MTPWTVALSVVLDRTCGGGAAVWARPHSRRSVARTAPVRVPCSLDFDAVNRVSARATGPIGFDGVMSSHERRKLRVRASVDDS